MFLNSTIYDDRASRALAESLSKGLPRLAAITASNFALYYSRRGRPEARYFALPRPCPPLGLDALLRTPALPCSLHVAALLAASYIAPRLRCRDVLLSMLQQALAYLPKASAKAVLSISVAFANLGKRPN